MPVALIVAGIIFGAAALNGTLADQQGKPGLLSLLSGDLFGKGGQIGFLEWAGALLLLSAIMKALDFPEAGKALIVLVILKFLLDQNGVPTQLLDAIKGLGTQAK